MPIGGMITSATRELMIFPKAPPMITPTARSNAFPFVINSLNSSINFFIFTYLSKTIIVRIAKPTIGISTLVSNRAFHTNSLSTSTLARFFSVIIKQISIDQQSEGNDGR
jgi:hypothetical protein